MIAQQRVINMKLLSLSLLLAVSAVAFAAPQSGPVSPSCVNGTTEYSDYVNCLATIPDLPDDWATGMQICNKTRMKQVYDTCLSKTVGTKCRNDCGSPCYGFTFGGCSEPQELCRIASTGVMCMETKLDEMFPTWYKAATGASTSADDKIAFCDVSNLAAVSQVLRNANCYTDASTMVGSKNLFAQIDALCSVFNTDRKTIFTWPTKAVFEAASKCSMTNVETNATTYVNGWVNNAKSNYDSWKACVAGKNSTWGPAFERVYRQEANSTDFDILDAYAGFVIGNCARCGNPDKCPAGSATQNAPGTCYDQCATDGCGGGAILLPDPTMMCGAYNGWPQCNTVKRDNALAASNVIAFQTAWQQVYNGGYLGPSDQQAFCSDVNARAFAAAYTDSMCSSSYPDAPMIGTMASFKEAATERVGCKVPVAGRIPSSASPAKQRFGNMNVWPAVYISNAYNNSGDHRACNLNLVLACAENIPGKFYDTLLSVMGTNYEDAADIKSQFCSYTVSQYCDLGNWNTFRGCLANNGCLDLTGSLGMEDVENMSPCHGFRANLTSMCSSVQTTVICSSLRPWSSPAPAAQSTCTTNLLSCLQQQAPSYYNAYMAEQAGLKRCWSASKLATLCDPLVGDAARVCFRKASGSCNLDALKVDKCDANCFGQAPFLNRWCPNNATAMCSALTRGVQAAPCAKTAVFTGVTNGTWSGSLQALLLRANGDPFVGKCLPQSIRADVCSNLDGFVNFASNANFLVSQPVTSCYYSSELTASNCFGLNGPSWTNTLDSLCYDIPVKGSSGAAPSPSANNGKGSRYQCRAMWLGGACSEDALQTCVQTNAGMAYYNAVQKIVYGANSDTCLDYTTRQTFCNINNLKAYYNCLTASKCSNTTDAWLSSIPTSGPLSRSNSGDHCGTWRSFFEATCDPSKFDGSSQDWYRGAQGYRPISEYCNVLNPAPAPVPFTPVPPPTDCNLNVFAFQAGNGLYDAYTRLMNANSTDHPECAADIQTVCNLANFKVLRAAAVAAGCSGQDCLGYCDGMSKFVATWCNPSSSATAGGQAVRTAESAKIWNTWGLVEKTTAFCAPENASMVCNMTAAVECIVNDMKPLTASFRRLSLNCSLESSLLAADQQAVCNNDLLTGFAQCFIKNKCDWNTYKFSNVASLFPASSANPMIPMSWALWNDAASQYNNYDPTTGRSWVTIQSSDFSYNSDINVYQILTDWCGVKGDELTEKKNAFINGVYCNLAARDSCLATNGFGDGEVNCNLDVTASILGQCYTATNCPLPTSDCQGKRNIFQANCKNTEINGRPDNWNDQHCSALQTGLTCNWAQFEDCLGQISAGDFVSTYRAVRANPDSICLSPVQQADMCSSTNAWAVGRCMRQVPGCYLTSTNTDDNQCAGWRFLFASTGVNCPNVDTLCSQIQSGYSYSAPSSSTASTCPLNVPDVKPSWNCSGSMDKFYTAAWTILNSRCPSSISDAVYNDLCNPDNLKGITSSTVQCARIKCGSYFKLCESQCFGLRSLFTQYCPKSTKYWINQGYPSNGDWQCNAMTNFNASSTAAPTTAPTVVASVPCGYFGPNNVAAYKVKDNKCWTQSDRDTTYCDTLVLGGLQTSDRSAGCAQQQTCPTTCTTSCSRNLGADRCGGYLRYIQGSLCTNATLQYPSNYIYTAPNTNDDSSSQIIRCSAYLTGSECRAGLLTQNDIDANPMCSNASMFYRYWNRWTQRNAGACAFGDDDRREFCSWATASNAARCLENLGCLYVSTSDNCGGFRTFLSAVCDADGAWAKSDTMCKAVMGDCIAPPAQTSVTRCDRQSLGNCLNNTVWWSAYRDVAKNGECSSRLSDFCSFDTIKPAGQCWRSAKCECAAGQCYSWYNYNSYDNVGNDVQSMLQQYCTAPVDLCNAYTAFVVTAAPVTSAPQTYCNVNATLSCVYNLVDGQFASAITRISSGITCNSLKDNDIITNADNLAAYYNCYKINNCTTQNPPKCENRAALDGLNVWKALSSITSPSSNQTNLCAALETGWYCDWSQVMQKLVDLGGSDITAIEYSDRKEYYCNDQYVARMGAAFVTSGCDPNAANNVAQPLGYGTRAQSLGLVYNQPSTCGQKIYGQSSPGVDAWVDARWYFDTQCTYESSSILCTEMTSGLACSKDQCWSSLPSSFVAAYNKAVNQQCLTNADQIALCDFTNLKNAGDCLRTSNCLGLADNSNNCGGWKKILRDRASCPFISQTSDVTPHCNALLGSLPNVPTPTPSPTQSATCDRRSFLAGCLQKKAPTTYSNSANKLLLNDACYFQNDNTTFCDRRNLWKAGLCFTCPTCQSVTVTTGDPVVSGTFYLLNDNSGWFCKDPITKATCLQRTAPTSSSWETWTLKKGSLSLGSVDACATSTDWLSKGITVTCNGPSYLCPLSSCDATCNDMTRDFNEFCPSAPSDACTAFGRKGTDPLSTCAQTDFAMMETCARGVVSPKTGYSWGGSLDKLLNSVSNGNCGAQQIHRDTVCDPDALVMVGGCFSKGPNCWDSNDRCVGTVNDTLPGIRGNAPNQKWWDFLKKTCYQNDATDVNVEASCRALRTGSGCTWAQFNAIRTGPNSKWFKVYDAFVNQQCIQPDQQAQFCDATAVQAVGLALNAGKTSGVCWNATADGCWGFKQAFGGLCGKEVELCNVLTTQSLTTTVDTCTQKVTSCAMSIGNNMEYYNAFKTVIDSSQAICLNADVKAKFCNIDWTSAMGQCLRGHGCHNCNDCYDGVSLLQPTSWRTLFNKHCTGNENNMCNALTATVVKPATCTVGTPEYSNFLSCLSQIRNGAFWPAWQRVVNGCPYPIAANDLNQFCDADNTRLIGWCRISSGCSTDASCNKNSTNFYDLPLGGRAYRDLFEQYCRAPASVQPAYLKTDGYSDWLCSGLTTGCNRFAAYDCINKNTQGTFVAWGMQNVSFQFPQSMSFNKEVCDTGKIKVAAKCYQDAGCDPNKQAYPYNDNCFGFRAAFAKCAVGNSEDYCSMLRQGDACQIPGRQTCAASISSTFAAIDSALWAKQSLTDAQKTEFCDPATLAQYSKCMSDNKCLLNTAVDGCAGWKQFIMQNCGPQNGLYPASLDATMKRCDILLKPQVAPPGTCWMQGYQACLADIHPRMEQIITGMFSTQGGPMCYGEYNNVPRAHFCDSTRLIRSGGCLKYGCLRVENVDQCSGARAPIQAFCNDPAYQVGMTNITQINDVCQALTVGRPCNPEGVYRCAVQEIGQDVADDFKRLWSGTLCGGSNTLCKVDKMAKLGKCIQDNACWYLTRMGDTCNNWRSTIQSACALENKGASTAQINAAVQSVCSSLAYASNVQGPVAGCDYNSANSAWAKFAGCSLSGDLTMLKTCYSTFLSAIKPCATDPYFKLAYNAATDRLARFSAATNAPVNVTTPPLPSLAPNVGPSASMTTLNFGLSFDADFGAFEKARELNRANFQNAVVSDLAAYLMLAPDSITVTSVKKGSIIVSVAITVFPEDIERVVTAMANNKNLPFKNAVLSFINDLQISPDAAIAATTGLQLRSAAQVPPTNPPSVYETFKKDTAKVTGLAVGLALCAVIFLLIGYIVGARTATSEGAVSATAVHNEDEHELAQSLYNKDDAANRM